MEKDKIAKLFISKLEDQVSGLRVILNETQKSANDSPGANESHSDTSRFQLGGIALEQEKRLNEVEKTLKELKRLKLVSTEKILIGSIFTLCGKNNEKRSYFIFQGAQGIKVKDDKETTIIAISATSPLGLSAIGKKKGEKVSFAAFEGEVTDVW